MSGFIEQNLPMNTYFSSNSISIIASNVKYLTTKFMLVWFRFPNFIVHDLLQISQLLADWRIRELEQRLEPKQGLQKFHYVFSHHTIQFVFGICFRSIYWQHWSSYTPQGVQFGTGVELEFGLNKVIKISVSTVESCGDRVVLTCAWKGKLVVKNTQAVLISHRARFWFYIP